MRCFRCHTTHCRSTDAVVVSKCRQAVHGRASEGNDQGRMGSRSLRSGVMARTCGTHDHPCWQAVTLIVLTIIAGCDARRPDSVSRTQQDCAAGDQWACNQMDALSRPIPEEDIKTQDNVKDDVDAILRGIDRARTAPRVGYPDVSPSTGELPTLATITNYWLRVSGFADPERA